MNNEVKDVLCKIRT